MFELSANSLLEWTNQHAEGKLNVLIISRCLIYFYYKYVGTYVCFFRPENKLTNSKNKKSKMLKTHVSNVVMSSKMLLAD